MLWSALRAQRLGAAGVLLATIACQGQPVSNPAPASPRAAVAPSIRPSGTTPACVSVQTGTAAAGITSSNPVITLAEGLTQPEDLLYDAGTLYVSEYGPGRVGVVRGGSVDLLPGTVPQAEGMVMLAGTLYVSGQRDDNVVTLRGGVTGAVLQLTPVPGVEGIDSIAPAGSNLLVPDSARGRLLLVTPAGVILREVTRFARPTGAWLTPDGSVLVADENAGTVVRVEPDWTTRTTIASGLPLVDDVAQSPDGTIYAVSISNRSLVAIRGGTTTTLAGGLAEPQGLTLDGAGNPIVTEYTAGRIDEIVTSFASPPQAAGSLSRPAGGALCVRIVRAAGFTAPVTIAPGSGYVVSQDVGAGDTGSVIPAPCAGTCRLDVGLHSPAGSVGLTLQYSG